MGNYLLIKTKIFGFIEHNKSYGQLISKTENDKGLDSVPSKILPTQAERPQYKTHVDLQYRLSMTAFAIILRSEYNYD